jgi:type III secretion protein Q
MNESSTPSEDSAAPSGGLSDVTIPLDFVIGTQSVPIEDLRTLSEGHVFEFPENSSTVSLVVNGRRHGSGRLVMVGDHLGVIVESLGEG